MAAQVFSCPECDHKLRSNNPIAPGKKVRCPRCQAVFAIRATAAVNSVATGIKKPALATTGRSLDDERAEAPIRKRREEAIAPPRKTRPMPRDEAIDDEEEEKPPRKKKKKRQASQAPLIAALSGMVALLVVFIVTAFLWPGFLLGNTDSGPAPKGAGGQPVAGGGAEGSDNVLAYMPADSAVLFGANVTALRALPTFPRDVQQLRTVFAMQGVPPEIADLLTDLDRVVVGVQGKQQPHFVAALSTTGPYDAEKIKKAIQAGTEQTVAGRPAYRLTNDPSTLLTMPNRRVIVLSNLPEQELGPILNSRQVTLDKDIQQQIGKVQSSLMWGLALNRGLIQEGLQALNPVNMNGLPAGGEKLIPYLQRAKAGFATIDMPGGKSVLMRAGLMCADANDAQGASAQLQMLWTQEGKKLLSSARFMLAAPGMEPIGELLNDIERSFKITHQGAEVTATVQISEKTMLSLEGMQQNFGGGGVQRGFNPGGPAPPAPPPLPGRPRKR